MNKKVGLALTAAALATVAVGSYVPAGAVPQAPTVTAGRTGGGSASNSPGVGVPGTGDVAYTYHCAGAAAGPGLVSMTLTCDGNSKAGVVAGAAGAAEFVGVNVTWGNQAHCPSGYVTATYNAVIVKSTLIYPAQTLTFPLTCA